MHYNVKCCLHYTQITVFEDGMYEVIVWLLKSEIGETHIKMIYWFTV